MESDSVGVAVIFLADSRTSEIWGSSTLLQQHNEFYVRFYDNLVQCVYRSNVV